MVRQVVRCAASTWKESTTPSVSRATCAFFEINRLLHESRSTADAENERYVAISKNILRC